MIGTDGDKQDIFDQHGVSPMIGIVLLFGIVVAGAVLLFAVGVPMIDAFESESERERAHMCMDEADHRLATVAATGEQQSMPNTDISDCDLAISNGGKIDIIWYNESEDVDNLPWNDDTRTASASLGALEFELEDRTIAHQGGGIWEFTSGETTIVSEPGISYNNDSESIRFNIMQLDEGELSSSNPIARADHDKTQELAADINEAASNSDGDNVAIRIESTYHDGWNQHLETALDADANANVSTDISHDPNAETVEVMVEGIRETDTDSTVVLEDDPGLTNPNSHMAGENRLEANNPLRFEPVLNNTGFDSIEQDLTLEVDNEPIGTTSVDLGGYDTAESKFNIGVGNYDLDPGYSYSYQYLLEDGTELLDTAGWFYLGEEGTQFIVTDDDIETTSTADGNTTISATIRNIGVENAIAQDISLEFDHPDIGGSEQELALDYGAEGTVEWTINESAWPSGDYEFTIETEDGDDATGVLGIEDGQLGDGFVIVEDHGVLDGPGDTGDQRVDVTESEFTIGTEIKNTNHENETEAVTLSIPGTTGSEPATETVTLELNESETVEFDLETDDFEAGTVYEYNVSTEDTAMTTPGSFYVGKSGTRFDPSDTNATRDDGTVTITAAISNRGIETGLQDVGFELEYLDDLPEELEGNDPYGYLGESAVDRSFGESDIIKLELNESKLLNGEYEATIHTKDSTENVEFTVDVGIDPGRVGLSEIEDAEVSVEVLGSQVSGDGWWYDESWESVHNLAPMTLDVRTNGDTEHSFENTQDGDNINPGPTWQNKSNDSFTHNFTVEDKTDLTLRNTRYNTCESESTDPNTLSHYSGPTDRDFMWCENAPSTEVFGPIDASEGKNLQNVRVRSAEDNTIPALPAGTDQQLSATEVLEQRGLVANSGDELELGPGEFVFLFENTESTNEEGIDALWNEAIEAYEQNSGQTHDPNFNDLIVYVEVERAGVDPGTPSITIMPGGGDETDVSLGGSDSGDEVGEIDVELGEGDSTADDSPTVGTGSSSGDAGDSQTGETGIDVDTDHILVG